MPRAHQGLSALVVKNIEEVRIFNEGKKTIMGNVVHQKMHLLSEYIILSHAAAQLAITHTVVLAGCSLL